MKTVSAKIDESTAETFHKIVLAKKLKGEDISKSDVLRGLLEEWIEEERDTLDDLDID